MLLPHAHAWSRAQKWLILTSGVVALAVLGSAIYMYERHYRGPGEEVLYGMWEAPDFFDSGDTSYFLFHPDQTFSLGGIYDGEFSPSMDGRWYAGGSNIYLRFSADHIGLNRPIILHIVDIHSRDFHVSLIRRGKVYTFRRFTLKPPQASNQAMQPTASPRTASVSDD